MAKICIGKIQTHIWNWNCTFFNVRALSAYCLVRICMTGSLDLRFKNTSFNYNYSKKKIALSLFFTIVIFVASQNAWKHSFIQTMFCDYLRDYIIVIWKISHADYFKEKLCVCFRQFMITYLKDWISFYITFSRLDLKIGIKSEKNEIPGSHTVWQQG